MTGLTPILIATIFVVLTFLSAMNRGVVKLLASGISALAALAALIGAFHLGMEGAHRHFGIVPPWRSVFGAASLLAVPVFVLARFAVMPPLKALFNPDGPCYRLSDGIPGGLLSLGPSAVAVALFFTGARIAGTLHELNYTASLSRDGISEMGGLIPPYPFWTEWRDGVERLPFAAAALDRVDPFSRPRNRNAAAGVLMHGSAEILHFLGEHPDTDWIVEEGRFAEAADNPRVTAALREHDRVALTLDPAVRAIASDPSLSEELESLNLRAVLEEFVEHLEPEEREFPLEAALPPSPARSAAPPSS